MTTLNKITLLVVLFSVYSIAQISITSTNFTYTQNFNTLSYLYGPTIWNDNSTLPGWYVVDPNTDTVKYSASEGGEGQGLRSLGSLLSTDRSLGSCSVAEYWGILFINNSGSSLFDLPIEFTGEQWRTVNEDAQTLHFYYSTNAVSLDDRSADWIEVEDLNFRSLIVFSDPASGLDGNLPQNSQTFNGTIDVLLLNGQSIWLKWERNFIEPKWYGLGIDDFKFNPNGQALPVELSAFSAVIIGSAVKLKWTTDTEVNNFGFEIERNTPLYPLSRGEAEGRGVWKNIGFVNGNGNSSAPKDYSFEDNALPDNANTIYYRLKQIDNDGQYEYSEIIEVSFNKPMDFSLNQNFPNPFNPETKISWQSQVDSWQKLKIFDILGNEVATLVDEFKPAGYYEINFNAAQLGSGIYFYQLKAGRFLETKKMIITK